MPLTPPHIDASQILVTGATGFIGAHIVRRLVDGGLNVLAVSRSRRADTRAASRQIKSIQCDLLDPRQVEALVRAHRPANCIHAAWDVARPDYLDSPANQKWVQASLHLARCLMDNGCQWLGATGTHVEPAHGGAPPNRYAAAKATLRNRLMELADDRMTVCWWRLFQPYGEGERVDRFVPSLLETLAAGNRFLVRQPAAQRDLIHADDLAAAIVACHFRQLGGIFDIGGGRLHALRDVATHAARCLDAEHLLDFVPHSAESTRVAAANISLLGELAAWQPEIDLDLGLQRLALAYSLPMRATA